MQTSALDDQVTVFHIDHGWLSYLPEMMKPIEAILQGSEITELFGDELETIASALRNAAQLDGYQESITSYFWKSKLFPLPVTTNFSHGKFSIVKHFIVCGIFKIRSEDQRSSRHYIRNID